jgi:hypothetical protein
VLIGPGTTNTIDWLAASGVEALATREVEGLAPESSAVIPR